MRDRRRHSIVVRRRRGCGSIRQTCHSKTTETLAVRAAQPRHQPAARQDAKTSAVCAACHPVPVKPHPRFRAYRPGRVAAARPGARERMQSLRPTAYSRGVKQLEGQAQHRPAFIQQLHINVRKAQAGGAKRAGNSSARGGGGGVAMVLCGVLVRRPSPRSRCRGSRAGVRPIRAESLRIAGGGGARLASPGPHPG